MLYQLFEALQNGRARWRGRDSRVGADPMVDPEQPVENPAVIAAIEAYQRRVSPESEQALWLALARGVYLAPAQPHLISIERRDGTRLVPPGLQIKPLRPQVQDAPVLVFTDESCMREYLQPGYIVQVLFAWEVFDLALDGPGLLLNMEPDPYLQLTPWHCRRVRRLLGRSGPRPSWRERFTVRPELRSRRWPAGWPQPGR